MVQDVQNLNSPWGDRVLYYILTNTNTNTNIQYPFSQDIFILNIYKK